MSTLVDFADIGPIPEPKIWTKPPLDLDALEQDMADKYRLPYGVGDAVVRDLISEVRELRKAALLRQAIEALRKQDEIEQSGVLFASASELMTAKLLRRYVLGGLDPATLRASHTAWTADRERAEKAEAHVNVLEAALEPFVNAIKWSKLDFLHLDISKISADDLRAARAAKEQSE